jgi:GTP-binding protein
LLFVVPADSENINDAYQILLGELEKYNPELLDKQRILGISKTDLIDDELKEMLSSDLPKGIPTIWFSAVTNDNLQGMKDLLWKTINADQ